MYEIVLGLVFAAIVLYLMLLGICLRYANRCPTLLHLYYSFRPRHYCPRCGTLFQSLPTVRFRR